jgi:hypothetical protein
MARARGRIEQALENELGGLGRDQIGAAERAALRAQARAVDIAEALVDPHLVTEANRGYLELRTAAGLSAAVALKPTDAFETLLADLARPGAGASDSPHP